MISKEEYESMVFALPDGVEIKKNEYYGLFTTKKIKKGESFELSYCFYSNDEWPNKINIKDNLGNLISYPVDYTNFREDLKNSKKIFWTYDCLMNHSCDPNTSDIDNTDELFENKYIVTPFKIRALRDINIGEELTCNYLSYDTDGFLIPSFECNCGSSNCVKYVSTS